MERWLIYTGSGLLVSFAAYGLYASADTLAEGAGAASLLSVLLTLGIVLSLGGAILQGARQRTIRRWLIFTGSTLVASFVGSGLYSSASALADNPSPANLFATLGALGMLLVLGGSAFQRARS